MEIVQLSMTTEKFVSWNEQRKDFRSRGKEAAVGKKLALILKFNTHTTIDQSIRSIDRFIHSFLPAFLHSFVRSCVRAFVRSLDWILLDWFDFVLGGNRGSVLLVRDLDKEAIVVVV